VNGLKELFNNLPEGVSIINSDLRIEWVNKHLHNKGFHCEGVTGKKCYFVYKNQKSMCKHCPTVKALSQKKTIRIIETGSDGKKYEVTAIPIIKEGKVNQVIEIVREIKKIEEKLKEKDSMFKNIAEKTPDIIYCVNKKKFSLM